MVNQPSPAFTPTCSVVVCTRDRPDALDRCLEALAQLVYARFEVVVVDNAPRDRRAEAVARRWEARYVVEPAAGLSRARNTGARSCSSEVVAFTDDDAVPDRMWLSRLAEPFCNPAVVVVTGRTLPLVPEGAARIAPVHAGDFGPEPRRLDRSHPLWFEMASFGGIGNGNNMAFRRRVFDEWRGFDERLGRGAFVSSCEEHRAYAELVERGHTIVYTPLAIVGHPVSETPGARRREQWRFRLDLLGYALLLFLQTRHRWRLAKYVAEAALGKKRVWRREITRAAIGGANAPAPPCSETARRERLPARTRG